jgi:fumarylacetoacetate (FAA) hydrolase
VPVPRGAGADGEGRPGQDAVLDLAMAANADPGLRPTPAGEPTPLAEVTLLTPVAEPPSIRDFYAFEQHVRTARARRGLEMHPDWYELPVFYFANPAAVIGPGDPVAAPPRSAELDYELEVACVLGRDGINLRLDDADRMVAGFTVMNDWSARDVQRREMHLSMGPAKGKDFATSLGPMLVTTSEFAPGGLREVPSEVAKSLPLAGPSESCISRRCTSLADQSFMTMKPATIRSASSRRRLAPSRPSTQATSSS